MNYKLAYKLVVVLLGAYALSHAMYGCCKAPVKPVNPFLVERVKECELRDIRESKWACKTKFGEHRLQKNCHRIVGMAEYVCESF